MDCLQTDKPRILVADDEPHILDLYGKIFTERQDKDPELSSKMGDLLGKLFNNHKKKRNITLRF